MTEIELATAADLRLLECVDLAVLEQAVSDAVDAEATTVRTGCVALALIHRHHLYGQSFNAYAKERFGISSSSAVRWRQEGEALIEAWRRGAPVAPPGKVDRPASRGPRGPLSRKTGAPPLSPSPNGASATIPTTATAVQPISTPPLDAVFPVVSNGSNGSGTHPVESLLALSARATAKEATYDLGRARSKALTAWLGEYNAAVAALKAKGPVAPESACPHPKATERHVGYGVLCGTCGAKVR